MNNGSDDTQARPVGGVKPSPELFQKWSRAQFWRPEDGVALAFGHDPEEIGRVGPHEPPRFISSNRVRFTELARRAVSLGELEEEATPSAYMEWAEHIGLSFHEIWTSRLNPRVPVGPDRQSETVSETVSRVSELIERRNELIKHWALAPTWTLREGACLANNVSPRLLSEFGNLPKRHPAAERVNRLIEFSLRAMRESQISSTPAPAVFIEWSGKVGSPFDPKWVEVIGEPRAVDIPARREVRGSIPAINATVETTQAQLAPMQEPGTRTRETMLKLIIGLAVGGYGYDPRSRRSDTPGSIADDLQKLGIQVTPETVRKYLDQGAELLSSNALKNHFGDD